MLRDFAALPRRLGQLYAQLHTPRLLFAGYAFYMLLGWALLSLPFVHEAPVAAVDSLFIAVSAVSTTGLVTVDPGASFNFAGELIILALFQIGGLGYMTLGSIMTLALRQTLTMAQRKAARGAFGLPEGFSLPRFLREVAAFTFALELAGALALWPMFAAAGVENPLWAAVFHAVSAFCTAGFSLFATSLEAFSDNVGVNLVIGVLAYCGAIGFLVFVDLWENATKQRKGLAFSTQVILIITLVFSVVGALALFFVEPTIAALPFGERVLTSLFQSMTATTTVGFNTVPIGALTAASIVLIYFLMMFGASPAGTGGGLKSTTLAVSIGLLWSTVRGRSEVSVLGHLVSPARVQIAAASVTLYTLVLFVAVFVLLQTERASLEVLAFEAISGLGTVGLSMGATGGLSVAGKLIVALLMFIGRVGIMTFGLAIAAAPEARRPGRPAGEDELVF